ncbi:hypothetical protein [Poseidonocella sedimentorum]|uniref:VPLPA-CTERM protein sorting domain-containing protein n=1 Tax=Poseidonocella sedimentorum TaxID=871652 RepID=A0A1I6DZH9_9RHOB|nr:hypothetical protein [Poseidonocella sedimentorum]SFR10731.1 VPLPA-CTERM protein sorting domain-containing protein [Poseidonocella sedimentorum]
MLPGIAKITAAAIAISASIVGVERAHAVTVTPITAGVAISSVVVGAAGATESGVNDQRSLWNRRIIGFLSGVIVVADPDPATFLSGTSVFAYPEELLEFEGLVWFGPFSDMSSSDSGPVAVDPVQGSGFTADPVLLTNQGPNPDLLVETPIVEAGRVTVTWSAEPDGIIGETPSVNMFGAVFKNISGSPLQFSTLPPGSTSSNLHQVTEEQSFICIPPGETAPRGCGYPDDPIRFGVTPVPLPATMPFMLLSIGVFGVSMRMRRR